MRRRVRGPVLAAILLSLPAAPNHAAPLVDGSAQRGESPVSASRFGISVDGVQIASFSELLALTQGFERQDLELTAEGRVLFPGRMRPPSVTLKRGMTNSPVMREWFEAAMTDLSTARKTCILTMFNSDGQPVARYYMENAWPSKLEIGGGFSAGSRDALAEIVTLVADSIREETSR